MRLGLKILNIGLAMGLSGCVPQWDMQGHDPKDYYAEHPIKNQVEIRTASAIVEFVPGSQRLTGQAIGDLRAGFSEIAPEATETVQIVLHPGQMGNELRKAHLSKILHGMGYAHQSLRFEPSDAIGLNEAEIDITYAAVVPPRCPDWRTSPVTTYSNTTQGGFGCASAVNLGQQVADPRDLIRGNGGNTADMERNALVIRQYRSGQSAGAADSSASAGGEAASSSAAPQ